MFNSLRFCVELHLWLSMVTCFSCLEAFLACQRLNGSICLNPGSSHWEPVAAVHTNKLPQLTAARQKAYFQDLPCSPPNLGEPASVLISMGEVRVDHQPKVFREHCRGFWALLGPLQIYHDE